MSDQPISFEYYLFIGTYSSADTDGVFLYKFNTKTGRASLIQAISGIKNPSFLTTTPDHKQLYIVSETHHNKDGQVYAYHFDQKSEKLIFINKAPTKGDDPCNIITDQSGSRLFVANFTSGSLAVLPVLSNGSTAAPVQLIPHHGHSIVKGRQDSAHVHCAVIAQDNQHLFVTDLGMDKVFGYLFNEKSGQLKPGTPPFTEVVPGSGPRLMEFSPDGKFLYLIHEISGQITVFRNDNGLLNEVEILSNLPKNYHGKIWAADVHLSPDGKFLYAANRDDLNDIVTYKVNTDNGKLILVDRQPTGGKTPRNFTITPDGKYILIGHKNGNEITVFERDERTGLLTQTDKSIKVPHAVCLKMIKK